MRTIKPAVSEPVGRLEALGELTHQCGLVLTEAGTLLRYPHDRLVGVEGILIEELDRLQHTIVRVKARLTNG